MSKKHKVDEENGSVGVADETPNTVATEVAAEAPKQKIGDAPTEVDTKKIRVPKTASYRILDGVDVTKFNGQRQQVVRALQKLDATNPGASWSLEEIVSNVEGLVSKTPIEASVKYHLNGLAKDSQVEVTALTPAPASTPATPAA